MITQLASRSTAPIFMLFVRVILFGLFQALVVVCFSVTWVESIPWWPITAILANIVCFILLSLLARRERKSYLDSIHFDRRKIGQDLKAVWWVLVVGGVVGGIGMNGFAYLMYGSFALPDNMIQPLPIWAAIVGLGCLWCLYEHKHASIDVSPYHNYSIHIIVIAVCFFAFGNAKLQ